MLSRFLDWWVDSCKGNAFWTVAFGLFAVVGVLGIARNIPDIIGLIQAGATPPIGALDSLVGRVLLPVPLLFASAHFFWARPDEEEDEWEHRIASVERLFRTQVLVVALMLPFLLASRLAGKQSVLSPLWLAGLLLIGAGLCCFVGVCMAVYFRWPWWVRLSKHFPVVWIGVRFGPRTIANRNVLGRLEEADSTVVLIEAAAARRKPVLFDESVIQLLGHPAGEVRGAVVRLLPRLQASSAKLRRRALFRPGPGYVAALG
jgi:hypothetical protein